MLNGTTLLLKSRVSYMPLRTAFGIAARTLLTFRSIFAFFAFLIEAIML